MSDNNQLPIKLPIIKPQINLYHKEDLYKEVQFNFKQLIQFILLACVATVLWNAYLGAKLYQAKANAKNAFTSQQQSYNELIRYQQEFPNKQTSVILTKVLDDKIFDFEEKSQVLDALNFNESTSFDGFYLYLDGLANADINQLWLTDFSFSNGMDSMKINGIAKQATFVTAYLKSLQNTAFSGATFNDISIVPYAENIDAIKFEISTANISQKTNQLNNIEPVIINTNNWSSLDENTQRAEQLSNTLIGGNDD